LSLQQIPQGRQRKYLFVFIRLRAAFYFARVISYVFFRTFASAALCRFIDCSTIMRLFRRPMSQFNTFFGALAPAARPA